MRQATFEDEPRDPFDDPEIQELIEAGARYGWENDVWNKGRWAGEYWEIDDEVL